MNRRTALKQTALIAGGIAWLPSCSFFEEDKVSIALNNLQIKPRHEKLLAALVETIIPATDTPGAQELQVHHFVLVMADDCLAKPEQEVFVKGLDQFVPYVKKHYDQSFLKSDAAERENILRSIMEAELASPQDENEPDGPAVQNFLAFTKQHTIQGYMVSQYVMTEVFPYQLVPGTFKGCVPTSEVQIM